jgi:hypothetical protein
MSNGRDRLVKQDSVVESLQCHFTCSFCVPGNGREMASRVLIVAKRADLMVSTPPNESFTPAHPSIKPRYKSNFLQEELLHSLAQICPNFT